MPRPNLSMLSNNCDEQIIEFNVYDRDAAPGDDDYLGHCELPLSTLKTDIESTFNLPLSKTKTGSLLIRAT